MSYNFFDTVAGINFTRETVPNVTIHSRFKGRQIEQGFSTALLTAIFQ